MDPPAERLIIGSRRSRLARVQAARVGESLAAAWPGLSIEYVAMSTAGDRDRSTPLPEIGGKGLFTADLERALESGEIDLAVHSLKDLPTAEPGDETLAAIPPREDPRDVLVLRPEHGDSELRSLPSGLRIGTSSVRRAAQVGRAIPGVEVVPIRGNVETRLARVAETDLDGVVLAAAGLHRLGAEPAGMRYMEPPEWPGAPGQGALAVQGRVGDQRVGRLAAAIHDPDTAAAVRAERSLLARLEGGCHAPIAAHAVVAEGVVTLHAAVYAADPAVAPLRGETSGPADRAAWLGSALADELLASGAAERV